MPKLRHYDNTDTVRFITFNCYRNEASLRDDAAKAMLKEFLEKTRHKYRFLLLGYVFMPDHVHLVIHPRVGTPVGRVVGEIKSLTAREWFRKKQISVSEVTRVFWQKRCYDHNCRNTRAVREKIEYCHINPVREGLVAQPED